MVQLALVNTGVGVQLDKHLFRYLLAAVAVMLSTGTIFYHFTEKWSWLDSYYFCVVTLATVGYGDFVPHTAPGKLFTTFYILAGVGIITSFFSAVVRRRAARIEQRQNRDEKNPS
jgi:voltage-gated potassium channel